MSIECTRYTPVNKGTLKGFATIFVERWGLEMNSITLSEKDGKRWVSFPAKAYEKDGKKMYSSYFRFKDEKIYKHFCDKALEAIEKKAAEIPTASNSSPAWQQEEIPF